MVGSEAAPTVQIKLAPARITATTLAGTPAAAGVLTVWVTIGPRVGTGAAASSASTTIKVVR